MKPLLRSLVRSISYIVLAANAVSAQQAPDTIKQIARIDADIVRLEKELQARVWPGFRFSDFGLAYIIPERGKLIARWPQPLPGFQLFNKTAKLHWTDTTTLRWQPSMPVAALAVSVGSSRSAVAGLALHEAFHAYQLSARREGRKFGQGENALLTVRYPLFDVQHEALFAVEAGLLERAVYARGPDEARSLARQFLAVRARRHSNLDSVFVNFDDAAELHEGLAQYTLIKGLEVLGTGNTGYREGAVEERENERRILKNPLAVTGLSPRRRAYATGSHLGLLLDRLAGETWKQDVVRGDHYLGDILYKTVGMDTVSSRVQEEIARALMTASESISQLAKTRAAQRDSILAGEVKLVIDPTLAGRFSWCGFDPQNTLATARGDVLHMRMINLCLKQKGIAMLQQPVVEEASSGRVLTSLSAGTFTLRVGGRTIDQQTTQAGYTSQQVQLTSANIDVDIASADLLISGTTILVVPRP